MVHLSHIFSYSSGMQVGITSDGCSHAFLYGDLDGEKYMQLTLGFNSPASGKVGRLCKSLYSLCQIGLLSFPLLCRS